MFNFEIFTMLSGFEVTTRVDARRQHINTCVMLNGDITRYKLRLAGTECNNYGGLYELMCHEAASQHKC